MWQSSTAQVRIKPWNYESATEFSPCS